MPITTTTGEKPQSKLWRHDGTWWGVLADTTGTNVLRLSGSTWTPVLQLTPASYRADVEAVGDVAHVLLDNGSPQAKLASIEFVSGSDGSPGTYRLWSQRAALTDITLSPQVGTMTIDTDCTGRMWLASDGPASIEVRYSDAPYDAWSDPIELAPNVASGDISVVTALPDCTVGVLWSNMATQRFGFRLHVDGAAPDDWSPDEVPASASALSLGGGMADNHLNVAVASDGTLYAAIKTKYGTAGAPRIGLLIRRPAGSWDPLYSVDDVGTRPIVLLNEATDRVLVAYTGSNTSGDIVYKESPVSTISFGDRQMLITGIFSFASSTKQNWTDSLVIVASGGGSAVGTLLTKYNQAPAVDAGPDQILPMSMDTHLDGTVSDDGLPGTAGGVTTAWSQVAGPGMVTFDDASEESTTARFSEPGVYVLQLHASDGSLSARDEVTIAVNGAPSVDAGPNQTLLRSAETTLGGTVADDGLPDATSGLAVTWTQVSGPGEVTFDDTSAASATAIFSSPGTYVLRLTATDAVFVTTDEVQIVVNATPTVNAGPNQVLLQTPATNLHGTANDDGLPAPLSVAWAQVSGPGTATLGDPSATDTTVTFSTPGSYVIRLTASDGAITTSDELTIGVNAAPQVDAGPDQILLDSTATIVHGNVSDDGIPNTGNVRTKWTKVSGLGLVTFGDVAAVDTTVSFSGPGSYVLRLTANDGVLPGSDDLAITVNAAPIVNAGPDQTIALSGSASLHGAVSDDGVANPAVSSTRAWSLVNGPGTVGFRSSTALDTTASFSAAGIYVLRLTAGDGALTGTDDVTIAVNGTPRVSAGPDQTILGSMAGRLQGTVTDDGLPNPPGRVRSAWTKVTGPGDATVANPLAPGTAIGFAAPGVYILRLTSEDGMLAASDDVMITINAPPLVDAGPDQRVVLPNSAGLHGAVSDDGVGNPSAGPGALWTVLSGPGPVNFGSPSAPDTTADFSVPGTYVFQLQAGDGSLNASDSVTITVEPPPTPVTTYFQDGVFPTSSYGGTQDTWIRDNSTAGKKLGSAQGLTATGRTDSAALLKWDISSVPSGSTVQSAAITIQVSGGNKDSFGIYEMERAWGEMSVTWNGDSAAGAWEIPGAAGPSDHAAVPVATIPVKARGTITIPLNAAGLALVQSWVDHPGANFGLVIQNYDARDNLVISSSESSTKHQRPQLSITYLPQEPSEESHALVLQPPLQSASDRRGARLTDAALATVAAAALARWSAAGIDAILLDDLSNIRLEITDLANHDLTMVSSNVIKVDLDAAGYGWFIDGTPLNDREFRDLGSPARKGSLAYGHVDLLTAIAHEIGHVLGLDDSAPTDADRGLMSHALELGVRRLPGAAEIDAAPGRMSSRSG